MYNTNFSRQLEAFRNSLFGGSDSRNLASSGRYFPPADIKILPCSEDVNGEFVPNPVRECPGELETQRVS
jgi:hypothetical protein